MDNFANLLQNSGNTIPGTGISQNPRPRLSLYPRDSSRASALTAREIEVLRLMADGLTTKAIATRLNVAFKTAACHRGHILHKLGTDSTVCAVRWAIREGIVEA